MWREVGKALTPSVFNYLKGETVLTFRKLRNTKYFRVAARANSNYGNDNDKRKVVTPGNDKNEDHVSNDDSRRLLTSGVSLSGNVLGKYKVFKDEDSEIIFDVEEERRKLEIQDDFVDVDEFAGISLKRGVAGVFDVHELVDVLKQQKAYDIFVVSIPPSLGYVSQMVIVTGRSTRHLQAIVEFILKLYKRKKSKNDPILKIEGLNSKNWKALDLGNIALHVFLKSTREMYDLESLWALGAEYDDLCRKPDDPLIALLNTPVDLEGMEPASSSTQS